MQTCIPSGQAPAPVSKPRLVRRSAGPAQPCATCGYHWLVPSANSGAAHS